MINSLCIMYPGQEHYGYESEGRREELFAIGWIERGMMGRNRQIFMNMQHVPLCPFVLLLKHSCSFT